VSGVNIVVGLFCLLCIAHGIAAHMQMRAKRTWEEATEAAEARLAMCNALLKAEWAVMDPRSKAVIRQQHPDIAAELDGVVH
jgi:hypothetical protein